MRLRLLSVTVRPVFVFDDGEDLQQAPAEPIQVAGKDWPTFIEDRWPDLLAEYEAQVPPVNDSPAEEPRNREQRRSAAKRARTNGVKR